MMPATSEAESRVQAEVDTCWKRIGVGGDKSCSQLESYIHCRNCPVYRTAARTLLDARGLDPGSSDRDSRSPLEPAATRAHNANLPTHSILVFSVAAEDFGVPTHSCIEVVEPRLIHSLPHRRSSAVLGLANVRGSLMICVSLPALLRGPQRDPPRKTASARLLVIGSEGCTVALPVDAVQGVSRYDAAALQPLPLTLAKAHTRHTTGVVMLQQRAVGVLDVERLSRTISHNLA